MTYILKTGSEGAKRLASVQALYGQTSQSLLTIIGIDRGMTVVDVGCGTGQMAVWMAYHVGVSGQVIAIDNSAEQIKLAKELANSLNISNITFINADAETLSHYVRDADIIYSRLLLVHNKCPLNILKSYKDSISNKGIIVCEEPVTSLSFTIPENCYFKKHLLLYRDYGKQMGLDFDFGNNLPSTMEKAGIAIHGIRKIQSALSNPVAKSIAYLRTKECSDKYLEKNMISPNNLVNLLEKLDHLSQDKTLVSGVQMIQAWGNFKI
jgi:SAM-dependent methyltransferase